MAETDTSSFRIPSGNRCSHASQSVMPMFRMPARQPVDVSIWYSCFAAFLHFRPGITERDNAVEYRMVGGMVVAIGDEIPRALELEPCLGRHVRSTGFDPAGRKNGQ